MELEAEVRASIEAEPSDMERSHVRRWVAAFAILRGDLGTAVGGIDLTRIDQGEPLRDRLCAAYSWIQRVQMERECGALFEGLGGGHRRALSRPWGPATSAPWSEPSRRLSSVHRIRPTDDSPWKLHSESWLESAGRQA